MKYSMRIDGYIVEVDYGGYGEGLVSVKNEEGQVKFTLDVADFEKVAKFVKECDGIERS